MNYSLPVLSVLLTIASHALAAPIGDDSIVISSSDEAAIRDLETKSWVAWKAHDAAFFERFLSVDHVEVHPHGVSGKAGVVEGVRSLAYVVQSYALGPFTLTGVSANTVLVIYRAEQETSCG